MTGCRHLDFERVVVGPPADPRVVFLCRACNTAFDSEPPPADPHDDYPRSSSDRREMENHAD